MVNGIEDDGEVCDEEIFSIVNILNGIEWNIGDIHCVASENSSEESALK